MTDFDARRVLATLDALTVEGLDQVWLSGGWGIDALEASQSADHHDLDLVIDLDRLDDILEVLSRQGFGLAEHPPGAPPRAVLVRDAAGHEIQLHPARFADDRSGLLIGVSATGRGLPVPPEGFQVGWVAGQQVRCLGPSVHVALHAHETWDPVLRARLVGLAGRFGVSLERHDRDAERA